MSENLFTERLDTPTGELLIASDEQQRLRVLDWDDKSDRMQRLLRLHYGAAGFTLRPATTPSESRRALEAYFNGELQAIDGLRTHTWGTDFQRRVWAALRTIPAGSTVSYGHIAKVIGRPAAVRAVGAANGSNPIAIVVPCHRVIGANATLTGYGGGLERKRWLLDHEVRNGRRAAPCNLELRV
jgi:methylated-DNA-[protein]-cysteine S-methyltransferase